MKEKARYKNSDPSVTQIIDILEKDWIIYWIRSKGFDYTDEIKKTSQTLGHRVHSAIYKFLKGYPFSKACDGLSNQEQVMLFKLTEWVAESDFKSVDLEKKLHSKKHKFNGTFDASGTFNSGKTLTLIDWKTDSTPRPGQHNHERILKYRYQAAGYAILIEENLGVLIEKAVYVRVTKDKQPLLTPIPFKITKSDKRNFLALRRIYKDVKGK